jgi:hypothetical protein
MCSARDFAWKEVVHMDDDPKVLEDAEAWLKQGLHLRDQLTAERETITKRLAEIDRYLATLPKKAPPLPPAGSGFPEHIFPASLRPVTVPDLIVEIVKTGPDRGLRAQEIIQEVQKRRPGTTKEYIYASLWRSVTRYRRLRKTAQGKRYLLTAAEAKDA